MLVCVVFEYVDPDWGCEGCVEEEGSIALRSSSTFVASAVRLKNVGCFLFYDLQNIRVSTF